MKNRIMIAALCLFSLLSIAIPNAFSQDSCPKTREEVKKDKRYEELISTFLYEFNKGDSSLHCTYITNGKLQAEVPYVSNKMEGIAKLYYESGKLLRETPYKAGKIEGVMRYYRASGRQAISIKFSHDIDVSGVCYHTNGINSPLTDEELRNGRYGYGLTCD